MTTLHWLQDEHAVPADLVDQSTLRLTLSVVDAFPQAHLGAVMKLISPEAKAHSWLIVQKAAFPSTIARLVALSIVDHRTGLLQPTLMPSRGPIGFLRDDGRFRHQMTRTLPDWAERMVEALAQDLESFATRVSGELESGPQEVLGTPPADFPMEDPTHQTYSVKAPDNGRSCDLDAESPPKLEWHQQVRLDYERDRYLAHLDNDELLKRGKAIFRNLHQIDSWGRVTLENDERTYFWMSRFTELIHEVSMRGLGPEFLGATVRDGIPLPTESSYHRFRIAGELVEQLGSTTSPYLVKYGHASHMRQALSRGQIRLGPADSYDDPSLGPARFDSELRHTLDVDMSLLPSIQNGRASFREGRNGRLESELRLSNFLMYCLSRNLRARLFADFDADAALVIREPAEFLARLERAVGHQLPGWTVEADRVEYYDPLNVSPGEITPVFWKHFAYAYQEEVRVACVPPTESGNLSAVFLELGSLEDIAEIVTFPAEGVK